MGTLEMTRIIWFSSFNFSGKIKEGSASSSLIWKQILSGNYFFPSNLLSLIDSALQIDLDPIKLVLGPNAQTIIDQYEKISFEKPKLKEFANFLSHKPISVKVVLFPKWSIGILVLYIDISKAREIDEILLVQRAFAHRPRTKDNTIFMCSPDKSSTETIIEILKKIEDKCGIKVNDTDDSILSTMYYFTLIHKSGINELERFGVLTRTLGYRQWLKKDVHRLNDSIIDLDKQNSLYLGPYSGSLLRNNIHEKKNHFYTNIVFLLILIRGITRHVLDRSISCVTSKSSIKETEKMLSDSSALTLLLTPNTLTNAYKFNSEILPMFLQATGLHKLRENLENMLRLSRDNLEKQRSNRQNKFLLYLSVIGTLLALLPLIQFILSII